MNQSPKPAPRFRARLHEIIYLGEWVFTILFTIEVILRMVAVEKPFRYLFSFFGLVDVLAVVSIPENFLRPFNGWKNIDDSRG